jgi:uncharacterized phage protein gp47/JayE
MSLQFPTAITEILDRIRTDVQNAIPESDPFLQESFLNAFLIGVASRDLDIYKTIKNAIDVLFPWSATGDYLRRWGLFKGLDIKPASSAQGLITVTGAASSIIPEGEVFQTVGSTQYEVINGNYTITENNISVVSITRSGSTAIVTTTNDHHYATNLSVTQAGADQAEYNITAIINVTGDKTYTYQVVGTPTTPATGTILSTATYASVEIRAIDTGSDTDLANGAKISLQTPISGVDNDNYVQYGEVSGGADEETDVEYRTRILDIYANPVSFFNVPTIEQQAKSIPGVTRVFVQEITPNPGQITVYFTRDDDDTPIPDGSEATQVKEKLLEIKPAFMDSDDLLVNDPALIGVSVNFIFSSLSPDTTGMREAIEENLIAMFKTIPEVGVNLSEDAYRSAIFNSSDPNTGSFVSSFTLSAPIGNISINSDEIAIYGTTTWSM